MIKLENGNLKRFGNSFIQSIQGENCEFISNTSKERNKSGSVCSNESEDNLKEVSVKPPVKINKNSKINLLRSEIIKCRKLGIPLNPNRWSRFHVLKWVHYISISTNTKIDFEKFSMNGRGLCYISLDGFLHRSPECGKLLHSELQKKLISHVYLLVIKSKSQKIRN